MHGEIVQADDSGVASVRSLPRMVRDLSRQLSKRVAFEVEGEEIEMDRAILDEIGDPLIHLLRNAVDHGIESTAERKKRNKPAEGRILLSAIRDRTSVAIRVKDDGQGIDRQKVLAKAVKEGHVPSGTTTLTGGAFNGPGALAAQGNISTARSVDVSGRGRDGWSVQGAGAGRLGRLKRPLAKARPSRCGSADAGDRAGLLARVGDERYAVPLAGVAKR
jgi:two-component system chemotaxis sensor kinase CheA